MDTEGAVRRFSGNSGLYERFLNKFLSDPTFGMVTDAFKAGDAQLALTATHTFKGLTANLGLTKLYNISSEMVSLIRDGDYGAAAGKYSMERKCGFRGIRREEELTWVSEIRF